MKWRKAKVGSQFDDFINAGYSPYTAMTLSKAGIKTVEEATDFLIGNEIHDFRLIRNIDKATDLIWKHIFDGKKICVFGDYDVDGVTASAIMFLALKRLGADVCVRLPDRIEEGYICKGSGEIETHIPLFTYHGFRYVHVTGITPQQATPELLTYNFMHSKLDFCGGFSCSDETVNALTAMVRRSDLSNFYYFPTDCPHREKHGWTGDAAFSSEHILQNMKADRYYREWVHQIRVAQHDDGLIPEIVPTPFDGWGYLASTGFDYVLIEIPWMLWKYRGDKQVLAANADAIWKLIGILFLIRM